jgi:hypothetical protein
VQNEPTSRLKDHNSSSNIRLCIVTLLPDHHNPHTPLKFTAVHSTNSAVYSESRILLNVGLGRIAAPALASSNLK